MKEHQSDIKRQDVNYQMAQHFPKNDHVLEMDGTFATAYFIVANITTVVSAPRASRGVTFKRASSPYLFYIIHSQRFHSESAECNGDWRTLS